MLSQLVYVSKRKQNCTEEEIDKILSSCKQNNPALNITGVLLYSNDKFIQLVEGQSQSIMDLYDVIKKDERHESCVMIAYNPIEEKTFPSWHMGSKKIEESNINFETTISKEDEKIFNSILMGTAYDGDKVVKTLKKFFD